MRHPALFLLLFAVACDSSGDAAPTLSGPADAEPIGPGLAVVCGAAASVDKVCTEADLEGAVATAVKEAGAQCEAKIDAARVEWAAGDEAAKAGAVDDSLLAVSEGYVAKVDAADTSEWAGVPLRMALGVAACSAMLFQTAFPPDHSTVHLMRQSPGVESCGTTCELRGCVDDSGQGYALPTGLIYNTLQMQWERASKDKSPPYCCCVTMPSSATVDCVGHDLD